MPTEAGYYWVWVTTMSGDDWHAVRVYRWRDSLWFAWPNRQAKVRVTDITHWCRDAVWGPWIQQPPPPQDGKEEA